MPVEQKPSATGSIMASALRKAGIGNGKKEQDEGTPASSAEAPASGSQAQAAAKPTPQPQVAQQRKPDVETPREVKKESSDMSNNQNDFSGGRRDQAPQFTTLQDAGSRRIRPIARSAGSLRAKELAEAMVKEMTRSIAQDGSSVYAIQSLDATALGLPVPAVVLLQTVVAGGEDHISMFSILLDGPDVRLPNRIDKVDGRPYETPTVVGDIYNSHEYIARAEELIKQARPTKKIKLIEAGGMVLPTTFNIEQFGVHGILYKATLATWNAMNSNVQLDDVPAYTLVGRNTQQEQLIGRLNFSGESYLDEVGHPVRSDVVLEMDSSRHQTGREFMTSSSNVGKVACYVEPVYAQPQQDPNSPNNQPFYAQAVITRMHSGYDAMDCEMILLDLVIAAMLQVQNGWADAFRPRYNRKGDTIDYRDIGGLGYCGPEATRFDSQSDAFKQNFPAFMRDMFRLNQGIIFAMDIPEVGPDAWAMDIFRASANNNANAIVALVKAADNLTGGTYSRMAQNAGNFPMIVDTGNRIHNGYYVTEAGETRDIRDIDLLAVANLYGKSNPAAIMQYAESFSPNVAPAPVRMSNRLGIIDDALNGRQVITGYSGRYILGPTFLKILTEACRDVGLVVNPANMVHGLGSGLLMGGYDYGAFTAGTAGASVYGGSSAAAQQTAQPGRSRW